MIPCLLGFSCYVISNIFNGYHHAFVKARGVKQPDGVIGCLECNADMCHCETRMVGDDTHDIAVFKVTD